MHPLRTSGLLGIKPDQRICPLSGAYPITLWFAGKKIGSVPETETLPKLIGEI
jgi:hypothetical protein